MKCPTTRFPQVCSLASCIPASSLQAPDSGWVEVFPKKLGAETVRGMVQRFKARYPSETLSPESMPSPRLLALVAKQLQDRSWRYIPWKLRLSEEQHGAAVHAPPI